MAEEVILFVAVGVCSGRCFCMRNLGGRELETMNEQRLALSDYFCPLSLTSYRLQTTQKCCLKVGSEYSKSKSVRDISDSNGSNMQFNVNLKKYTECTVTATSVF